MNSLVSILGLSIVTVVLSGCGEPIPAETITEVQVLPVEISEDDLFKGNKILAFLNNEEKFVREANELFLKGLNAFKNENDLDSADYYLRKSLLKEPSSKAYYELANVYMDKKAYDDALLAYGMAEQLDFQPFSKILYNKACIYSLQDKKDMSAKYLEYALQAGYNNIEHINVDSDLENLRDSWLFNESLKKGLRGVSNSENLFWLQFRRLFPQAEFPIKLKTVFGEDDDNLKNISYEFEKYVSEMRDEEFSREVSKGFYQYAQAYETNKFVALIYLVRDEFMGPDGPSVYRMATFTHEGKLIDKKEIGGRTTMDANIMDSELTKDFKISVILKKTIYKYDPDDKGYFENEIVDYKNVGRFMFKVREDGKIDRIEGEQIELLSDYEELPTAE